MNNFKKNKGFTLPEVLIALAISSIIMLGVFGSYLMFNNTYYFQRDLTQQSNTSRNIIDILNRDLRMAGFSIMNASASNSIIAEPVVLNQPIANANVGAIVPTDCGEGITIQYDLFDSVNGNTRIEVKYQAEEFTGYEPIRCRLIREKTYYNIPYVTGAEVSHPNYTDTTEVLADYIYDLSFELYDNNYNHMAGRRFLNNPNPSGDLNYINATCQNSIDNHTPCSQNGYNNDINIIDIILVTIAPEENPTLRNDPTIGRRFLYDVHRTIKLRNVN